MPSWSIFAWWTGTPWVANAAPITGPMYQLFIFFMVTEQVERWLRPVD
jgi:hypothetical protein